MTYFLDEGELHNFHVVDVFGDGIDQGFVRLFLGTVDTTNDRSVVLDIGNFCGIGVRFCIHGYSKTSETEPPETSEDFLTLELYMYIFHEGISIALSLPSTGSDLDDHSLFFRPPRHYAGPRNVAPTDSLLSLRMLLEIRPKTVLGSSLRTDLVLQLKTSPPLSCRERPRVERLSLLAHSYPTPVS
jgi:hypothetical protein